MEHVTGAELDRLDHLRDNEDVLTSDAFVITFGHRAESVLLEAGPKPRLSLMTLAEALASPSPGPIVLLGEDRGTRWAARAGVEAPGTRFEPVRAAASSLPRLQAGLVVYGAGLLAWHHRAGFCGECGGRPGATSAVTAASA